MPSVCIINYGLGNLSSVQNALELLGVSSVISSNSKDIAAATLLILPGVGSFEAGMRGLRERGIVNLLREEVIERKKPILGICLGLQLFASKGFEHGEWEGLRFIDGSVVEIQTTLRLPQIGWNNVTIKPDGVLTKGFVQDPIFYFVHSYHLLPTDPSMITGTCDYGISVTAIVEHENIFGTQFHPEKSHADGLHLLKNFLNA